MRHDFLSNHSKKFKFYLFNSYDLNYYKIDPLVYLLLNFERCFHVIFNKSATYVPLKKYLKRNRKRKNYNYKYKYEHKKIIIKKKLKHR
jgi:hypothetical protein